MKEITQQALNEITVIGKLLDVTTATGTTQDGQPYERANFTIRATHTYNGREETSEIPLSMFATQFTKRGTPNPAYANLQTLKTLKTVQNVGWNEADTVRVTRANLRENAFVTKSGQLINGWQINASFINQTNMQDIASFSLDIFIMDMHPEEDKEGDPTGRLIVKGGLVQYGGKLDVIEFVVENPTTVDHIERFWEVNDTVHCVGRIRVTSMEEKRSGKNSGWGEDIPETSTRYVRELVITFGDDEGKEEEFAYDPTDIKKAFNVRKANIEQMQLNTKKAPAPAAQPAASKYSWE